MSEKKLTQIFLLHSVKFVCEALREHAKQRDVSLYVIDDPTNFSFFLEDMAPEVVIAHSTDLEGQIEDFIKQFEGHDNILKILWAEEGNDPTKVLFDDMIVGEISPGHFVEQLESMLESYRKKQ